MSESILRLTWRCKPELATYKPGVVWVASCAECYLVTQANSLDDLLPEVRRISHAHFEAQTELNQDPMLMSESPDMTQYFSDSDVIFYVDVEQNR